MEMVQSPVWRGQEFFFFNDTATTEIYTLSLHDALPIWPSRHSRRSSTPATAATRSKSTPTPTRPATPPPSCASTARTRRSEEHTSELQSRQYLVCRLLLEKKKTIPPYPLRIIHLSTSSH